MFLSLKTVRDEIIRDEQVMMCFVSPGEDGLKVMFQLKERCYDAGLYHFINHLLTLSPCVTT